ncbi:MAG: PorP/SprF family type IX secretion system membrane protein, partial [Bacteroidetes bacterium]|nr:PorP/SprF family type IX secretion system membrane protein [Bacteroidota bacterium]
MRQLLTIVLFLLMQNIHGQEVHFSQFGSSPLTLNPALTGMINGNYRIVGNFREQWKSVTVPYSTFSSSIDMPILRSRFRQDNLGAGFIFYRDIAGDSRLSTSFYSLSLGFTKALDSRQRLTIGLQPGLIQKSINFSDLQFGSQFNGRNYDPGLASNENMETESFRRFD